jgi:hypothetical protein
MASTTNNPNTKIESKERFLIDKVTPMMYPLNLGSISETKYTVFTIYKYSKTQVNHAELKDVMGKIYLPIPPELSNTDAFAYEEFSAPVAISAIEASQMDHIGDFLKASGGVLAAEASNITKHFKATGALPDVISAGFGVSVNPRNTNIFKSPIAREHKFTFRMLATSVKESIAIRQIINKFKYHAQPSYSLGESIYNAPELFQIQFKIGDAPLDDIDTFLFHPLPSALIAISVTYNGSSTPAFFKETNAPVEVALTLIFKEMELDDKDKMSRYGGFGLKDDNASETYTKSTSDTIAISNARQNNQSFKNGVYDQTQQGSGIPNEYFKDGIYVGK